jgi:hypothetical protein
VGLVCPLVLPWILGHRRGRDAVGGPRGVLNQDLLYHAGADEAFKRFLKAYEAGKASTLSDMFELARES